MLRSTAAVVSALVLATGLAGCGGDDDGGDLAAGDGFSVEAALAELAVPDGQDDQLVMVSVADLDAAAAANDAGPRPDAPDDEAAEWLRTVAGSSGGETTPIVMVPPVDVVGGSRATPADAEDELGWSLLDVEAVAEVVAPPFRFAVVAGDLDEDTLADADLARDGDVFSVGVGEDGDIDPDATTAVRPIGAPLRMAAADGRLAVSTSTGAVEDWVGGEAETLADDDDLAAVAAALDDGDVVSAYLARGDFTSTAVALGNPEAAAQAADSLAISEPFAAVGIGWASDDGRPVFTVAYAFADEGAAADGSEQVEAAYAEGASLQTRQPLADLVELEEVTTDGAVVVARLTPVEEGRPQVLADMLLSRDLPFAHA